MKKIQNAKILTNQQMKHISGGWQKHQSSFTTGGGGTCPVNATGIECTGKCDLPNKPDGGSCGIYVLAGTEYCACIE